MSTPAREYIDQILNSAFTEDLGETGDITSCAIFESGENAQAVIRAKEAGKISGIYLLKPIFNRFDRFLVVETCVADGDQVAAGTVIARLSGSIRAILAGERTALNFLQRLSGIATATAALTALIANTGTRLLDTRKTTPGLRWLEKKAVVDGGGTNHRFGLYDMVLIKDTHVKAAGGVVAAIRKVRAHIGNTDIKIEAEVQTFNEFVDAAAEFPNRIMLDNMSLVEMKKCVELKKKQRLTVELEASGNITHATIAEVAATGVDFISIGAITHSVRALDIHLVIV